ncbi:MAG: hypothetical protein K8T26_11830 [Lentisphaerae bacterium]|nr:hypothetical protein [Lentisphaerota bacterium]
MTTSIWPRALPALLVVGMLGTGIESFGQGAYPAVRRAGAPAGQPARRAGEAGVEAPLAGDAVQVRQLIGTGRQTLSKTPEFKSSVPKSSTRPKDWVQISVKFDTVPEWITSLVIEYNVMTMIREGGTKRYSLYRQSVDHMDVERGRDHLSAVFIPPSAVKRFGMPVAVHVSISADGQPIAKQDELDPEVKGQLPADWWQNPTILNSPNVTARDGYLWRLNQTPFALVNPDDYEVMR